MRNLKSFFRDNQKVAGVSLFVLSTFLQRGLSLVTTPLFTRLLNTYDYGMVSTYNTWSGVLSVLFTLSIAANAFNVGLVKCGEKRNEFVSSMIGITGLLVAFGAFLVSFFKEPVSALSGLPYRYFMIMFINMFFDVVYGFWGLCCKFDKKYSTVVFANLGLSILSIILSATSLYCIDFDPAFVKIISGSSIQIVFGICLIIHFMRCSPKLFVWTYWKAVLLFCIPLIPHYMSNHLLNQADRIMITSLCGADKTAIYTLANKFPELVNIFWGCVSGVYVPWLYKNLSHNKEKEISRTNAIMVIVVSLVALCVTLMAPEVMWFLAPQEYQQGVYIVPILMVGYSASFTTLLCSHMELFNGKNFIITVITLLAAVINIVLNWIFIPLYGYQVAAYTTFIGYAIMFILHYVNLRRLGMNEYINLKMASRLLLLNTMAAFLMITVYDKSIVRYTIIAIAVFVAGLNYKKMWNYIKMMKACK